MKYIGDRPLADPEAAVRKILEIASHFFPALARMAKTLA
jgi:hypothetical protein